MNRYLMGLVLALAATAVAADCKQDCKEAYTQCTQGATTLDDTMQCKKQYKECTKGCDASGIAAANFGTTEALDHACDPVPGKVLAQDARPVATR